MARYVVIREKDAAQAFGALIVLTALLMLIVACVVFVCAPGMWVISLVDSACSFHLPSSPRWLWAVTGSSAVGVAAYLRARKRDGLDARAALKRAGAQYLGLCGVLVLASATAVWGLGIDYPREALSRFFDNAKATARCAPSIDPSP